jgi:divalent metal cation (Fe/Co/Zn/Cd) transporter
LVGRAFLLLTAYVAFEAARTLLAQETPDASPVGIAQTGVSIVVMLWLARAKRRVGEPLRSRALVADAQQTYAGWYLSVVTLTGLALNAAFGWRWADPGGRARRRRAPGCGRVWRLSAPRTTTDEAQHTVARV